MPMDASRAGFVRQEFRYFEAKDTSVRSKFPTAFTVEIDSNLDKVDATARANALLTELKQPVETYECTYDGIITDADLTGSAPRFTCDFPFLASDTSRTFTLVSFECDDINNTTRVVVRG